MAIQIIDALSLLAMIAVYFAVPYFFLRRSWFARAGLAMLAVAIVEIMLINRLSSGFGAAPLPFLMFPLPLILTIIGTIMALQDWLRSASNSQSK